MQWVWTDVKVGGKVSSYYLYQGALGMSGVGSEWLRAANKRFALSVTGWL